MRRGRPLLLLLALLLAPTQRAMALPPVWTVRTHHATLILFGSVHLLPAGLDWEPPPLAQAIGRANEIWFELPINAATNDTARQLVTEKGVLPKGGNLFDHLSAQEADRLRKACAEVNVPPEMVASMRPWLAEVTLSLAQDAQAGAKPSEGVEQQLSDQAPAAVQRRAFETPGQQIGFLASAPLSEQTASLRETLSEIADDPDIYNRVVKAWLAGDLAALRKDALQPLAKSSPGMYRRLIVDRNHRWADTLARRLKGQGVIVVVVGTGHLLGPDGVPALLRDRGFVVDGPDLEDRAAH